MRIYNPLNKSLRASSKESHCTASKHILRHPPVTLRLFLFFFLVDWQLHALPSQIPCVCWRWWEDDDGADCNALRCREREREKGGNKDAKPVWAARLKPTAAAAAAVASSADRVKGGGAGVHAHTSGRCCSRRGPRCLCCTAAFFHRDAVLIRDCRTALAWHLIGRERGGFL